MAGRQTKKKSKTAAFQQVLTIDHPIKSRLERKIEPQFFGAFRKKSNQIASLNRASVMWPFFILPEFCQDNGWQTVAIWGFYMIKNSQKSNKKTAISVEI